MTLGSLRGSGHHSPTRPGAGRTGQAAGSASRGPRAPRGRRPDVRDLPHAARQNAGMLPTSAGPRDPLAVEPVPYGRTARRLDWLLLPPALRRLVESQFGTAVVHAESSE